MTPTTNRSRSVVVDVVDQVVLHQPIRRRSPEIDRIPTGVMNDVVSDRHIVRVDNIHRGIASTAIRLVRDLKAIDHQIARSRHIKRLAPHIAAIDHHHPIGQIRDRISRRSRIQRRHRLEIRPRLDPHHIPRHHRVSRLLNRQPRPRRIIRQPRIRIRPIRPHVIGIPNIGVIVGGDIGTATQRRTHLHIHRPQRPSRRRRRNLGVAIDHKPRRRGSSKADRSRTREIQTGDHHRGPTRPLTTRRTQTTHRRRRTGASRGNRLAAVNALPAQVVGAHHVVVDSGRGGIVVRHRRPRRDLGDLTVGTAGSSGAKHSVARGVRVDRGRPVEGDRWAAGGREAGGRSEDIRPRGVCVVARWVAEECACRR